MTRVTYVDLLDGRKLATAAHRPEEYLTWVSPAGGAGRNVFMHRASTNWTPISVGWRLDYRAFQIQAETILGVTEHAIDAAPAPTHELRDRALTTFCSCGHWRTSAPINNAARRAMWVAHIA